MSTTTLIICTICFAIASAFYLLRIVFIHLDFKYAFYEFKEKHYPKIQDRRKLGHQTMKKYFYQWIGGQYFGLFLTGYGLIYLLIKIYEKL